MSESQPPQAQQPTATAEPVKDGQAAETEAPKPSKLKPLLDKLATIPAKLLALPMMIVRAPFALFGGDGMSRFLVIGFIAGVLLLLISGAQLYDLILKRRALAPKEAVHVDPSIKFNEELKLSKEKPAFLEQFTVHLLDKPGNAKQFEIEMFFECSKQETSKWIKQNETAIRDIVNEVLQGQKLEVLMTTNGKEALKTKLKTAVNSFLTKQKADGKIDRIFFTNYVLGS